MKYLDENDSIILRTLLLESRTGINELAKATGISSTAVIRRYNRLKKSGIILGEKMHLNPASVGYEAIAEVGIVSDLENRVKLEEMLRTNSPLMISPFALGKYDLNGLLVAKRLAELNWLVQRVDIKHYIKTIDILIFANLWNSPWHPENIVINNSGQDSKTSTFKRPTKTPEPVVMEAIDVSIAKALMVDSRVPFSNVAEKLGISTSYTIERYRLLRQKNILNLSTIIIDISKLGYNANVDSYIKVANRGDLPEIESQLLQIPNLTFSAEYLGGAYDLRVATHVSDFQDVHSVKQKIRAINGINNVEFYLFENPPPWFNDFIGQITINRLSS